MHRDICVFLIKKFDMCFGMWCREVQHKEGDGSIPARCTYPVLQLQRCLGSGQISCLDLSCGFGCIDWISEMSMCVKFSQEFVFNAARVMEQMAKAGYHCIAPDWIGFGFSEKPQPEYDFSYTGMSIFVPELLTASNNLKDNTFRVMSGKKGLKSLKRASWFALVFALSGENSFKFLHFIYGAKSESVVRFFLIPVKE